MSPRKEQRQCPNFGLSLLKISVSDNSDGSKRPRTTINSRQMEVLKQAYKVVHQNLFRKYNSTTLNNNAIGNPKCIISTNPAYLQNSDDRPSLKELTETRETRQGAAGAGHRTRHEGGSSLVSKSVSSQAKNARIPLGQTFLQLGLKLQN